MTSKYGFSVVAPISVTMPSSTAGSSASCCALLKRWISSRKRIVRWPFAPSRSRAARDHLPDVLDRRGDGRELLEVRPGRVRDHARERRLAAAGRAVEDHRRDPVLRDRESQRRALAEHVLLADELVERRGRMRSASGATSGSRSWAASEKRSLMPEVCCAVATPMRRGRPATARATGRGFRSRSCPGRARSDYERYLRTDELLALQKTAEEWRTATSCCSRPCTSPPSSG